MSHQIDFLPEDYLEKKSQKRTNIICLFLFVIVAAGVGTAFLLTEQRNHAVEVASQAMNAKMAHASKALKQLELLENKKKLMNDKAAISAILIEPVPRSLLLATITNDLPAGMSLLEFTLASKEIMPKVEPTDKKKSRKVKKNTVKKVVAPKCYETTIEVTGLAFSDLEVATLIANLGQSFLFDQVTPVFTEAHEIDEVVMRRFKLRISLDPTIRADKESVELVQKNHVEGF
ncbi:MAG: PilN domain-containing protein [Phycisphaerae bacterium]|nr:PilN domain-containing protein [Phycisphaerae bacterium]